MKIIAICCSLIFTYLTVFGQKQKDIQLDLSTFYAEELKLKAFKDTPLINIPFRSIKVYDKRSDTSIMGFCKVERFGLPKDGYFSLKDGASSQIESFLKTQVLFDSLNTYNLTIIIRKLWLSPELENNEVVDFPKKTEKFPFTEKSRLFFKSGVKGVFDFYAVKDSIYIPITRFDSIIKDRKTLYPNESDLIEDFIYAALKKVPKINLNEKFISGKKLNWKEVDEYSSKQYVCKPLYISEYKKGVYLTYEEFKKDEPSIKNFEIKKTDKADLLFVKDENGTEYPIRKIWGFSDGKTIYIKSVDVYFALEKFNNNFYTMAAKKISKKGILTAEQIIVGFALVAAGGNNLQNTSSYSLKLFLKPYQLDLETGILY